MSRRTAPIPALRAVMRPRHVRATPVTLAALTLLVGHGVAQAQDAKAVQSVTVTGIRAAIESAITTKRDNDLIVEAITSEDIGKLPDVSIGESLARLPGLAAQRVAGRAQVIAIRGMPPDFAGTLLNGRAQVTTGDNRSVEYDQFPSELISAATVYKTADASLMGQGLSGTIDLKSIRPLDLRGRAVTLNARVESNSNGTLNAGTSGKGNRFSISYVDQFANNTLGVALGYAHLDSPTQQLHYKAWGFSTFPSTCRVDWGCGQPSGGPNGSTYLNGFEVEAISASQKRDGLMAVLEYKPNKDLHSTLDLYYSKFKRNETMRGLMGGLGENWNGVPGSVYSNVGTSAAGANTTFINHANVTNAVMVVRNDANVRDDELKSAGWNTRLKMGGGWSATADLSYSTANRHEDVIETYAGPYNGTAKVAGSFTVDIPSTPAFPMLVPGLNYADASTVKLSDPAVWSHDGLWKKPKMKDTIQALRLEAHRDLGGMFTGVDFGLNYATRKKEREMNEVELKLKNSRAPVAVDASLLQQPTSLSFASVPGVLSYNVMGIIDRYMDQFPTAAGEIINRNYTVDEKVTTAFARLGIDTTLGSMPLHGNAGLQFIHTDQSSHGYSALFTEISRGKTYDDVLPSLNLTLDVTADTRVRMGLGKTLARGRMDDMRAGATASINNTSKLWSGSGGNPELEPWRATSYDLSVEQYFGKRSYVALAGFYKSLASYIYKEKVPVDFSFYPNPTGTVANSPIGLFETPQNGQGGRIHGVELSGSLDFGHFVKALDGFGISANYTVIASNLRPNGPTSALTLPGLSPRSGGMTLYYESGGFSARVGYRDRSAFRGEVTGLHNAREFPEFLADRQTDLQLSYEFQSGAAKGLQVLLQVNNLRNSPVVTRQGNGFGDVIAPSEYNKFGRQTLLGLTYKL